MGIQPATAINKNRNGFRTLGISIAHYCELRATDGSPCRFKQIQFLDHTGSSILMSPLIPPPSGPANNCGRPSRLIRLPVTCFATVMAFSDAISPDKSKPWASRKYSRRRGRLGNGPMSSASLAPFAGSALITRSVEPYSCISPITMGRERICRSAKTPRILDPCIRRGWGASLPFPRWAGCITATSGAPPNRTIDSFRSGWNAGAPDCA